MPALSVHSELARWPLAERESEREMIMVPHLWHQTADSCARAATSSRFFFGC